MKLTSFLSGLALLVVGTSFAQEPRASLRNHLLVLSNEPKMADEVFRSHVLTVGEIKEAPEGWLLHKKGVLTVLIDDQLVHSKLGHAHTISQQFFKGKSGPQVIELDSIGQGYREALNAVIVQCGMGARTMRAMLASENPKVGFAPVVTFEIEVDGQKKKFGLDCYPEDFRQQTFSAGVNTLDLQAQIKADPAKFDGNEFERQVTAERELHSRFQAVYDADDAFDDALAAGLQFLLERRKAYRKQIMDRWLGIVDGMLASDGYVLPSGDSAFDKLDPKLAGMVQRQFLLHFEQQGFGSRKEAEAFLRAGKVRVVNRELAMTVSRSIDGSDGRASHIQRTFIRF